LENLDIEIFVNFMKSYVLSPIELKQRIDRVLNFHKVKGIYLVDSAGGMMPHEIEIFSSELKNYSVKTKLGFHGHDNLGLAVYNSIFLAQNGFTLIDCSMQGIGRSSGNASTEKLLAGLKRLGLVTEYDLIDVLKEGEKLIRPMLPNAGHGGLDTFAGYMLFHTSYMENLLAVSSELCVDPYLLMQEHCAINQISGSKNELLASAKKVTRRNKAETEIFMPPDRYPGNEQI
jgi:4-hydroxy 2-oxovalerate aldolase/long-chain acyl-CoA synthetase